MMAFPVHLPESDIPADFGKRERDENGAAIYAADELAFALQCEMSGFALAAFDNWLDTWPQGPERDQFVRWRWHAFQAFMSGNPEALFGWLNALNAYWQARKRLTEFEPLYDIGIKSRNGGTKGHERTYGTREEKADRREQFQKWVNEAVEANEKLTFEAIKRLVVAKHNGKVSKHQLKRYTKDPRKK